MLVNVNLRKGEAMQYIVDIVLALIILISTVRGYRRGFVKTFFGLAAVALSVLSAYLFSSAAGSLIRQTAPYKNLCKSTTQSIQQYFEDTARGGSDAAFGNIDDKAFVKQMSSMGIDVKQTLDDLSESTAKDARDIAQNAAKSIAIPALETLSNVLATVLVFIISLALCMLLSRMLSNVFKLPFLNGINKIFGLILGFILGVVYSFILCMIIKCLLPAIPENPFLYVGMEKDTMVYGFLCSINPVYLFLLGRYLI